MARLILEHKSKVLKDYPFINRSISIGRHADNNIVLNDTGVSSFHARIDKRGVEFILTDLQSTNGTTLNDVNIVSHKLSHGDKITIGDYSILFIGTEMEQVYEEEKVLDFNSTTIKGASRKKTAITKPRTIIRNEVPAAEMRPVQQEKQSQFLKRFVQIVLVVFIITGGILYLVNSKPALLKNIIPASIWAELVGDELKKQQEKTDSDRLLNKQINGSDTHSEESTKYPDEDVSLSSFPDDEQSDFNDIDEPELILEGTVMANNPKDSYAIINGRMIKAGRTIEGGTIVKISKQYVIIRYPKEGTEIKLSCR
jgi:pSer/pThr/pTyr-binding forkhead associated (FHA) protein